MIGSAAARSCLPRPRAKDSRDHDPIAHCAPVGSASAALVSRGGSIDWLCFPRFDSPSTFGRLLDEKAGHWFFGATNATEVSRRYLDRTMVLETTLRTPTGSVTITDALAMGSGNRGHELGKGAPHVLLGLCLQPLVHSDTLPRPMQNTPEMTVIDAVLLPPPSSMRSACWPRRSIQSAGRSPWQLPAGVQPYRAGQRGLGNF